MPVVAALPAIIGGISSVAGAALSKSPSTNTARSEKATSTPVEDPAWGGLRNQLISMAMAKLKGEPTDLGGYAANGITNINNASDAATMARNNALAARGLSASPIAGNADIISQDARGSDIAQFQNTLPMVARDFANQDWTQALNLFNNRPKGASTTGSSTGSATQNESILPGLFGGLGEMISGGYLTNLFKKGGSTAVAAGGPTLNPYTGEWE
jgi:hypothetical protein